jgi:aminomethyltransferase
MPEAALPRPRLLEPGLRLLPPGTERYRVRGGGAMVVAMGAGDTLEIIDPEGRQPGELTIFGPAGINDCGLLGARSTGPSCAMAGILSNDAEDARAVASALRRRGIDASNAQAVHVFGPDSRPGERIAFTADQESICIVAAPGGPMRVDEQNPPTDLIAYVRRASLSNIELPPLPEPLAEPRLDMRVDRCTARAYQVKAGEYIQIIDVEGRECTDFQAFTLAALDQGNERGLDPTTTRSLMGAGASRQLQSGLHRQVLRRHGLSRPRELFGQFQQGAGSLRHCPSPRLGGHELLLQHQPRRQ